MHSLLRTEQLNKDFSHYIIVNPLLFARKLNGLLRSTEIRREFHRASVAADAVKRWDCMEHFNFNSYPEPRRPLDGEEFLMPWQVVTMDWDWDLPPGRRPIYHQFVMPALCHWRAGVDLTIARRLMPQYEWVVVSGPKHTAVIAPEGTLIWDPTYFALDVSAQEAIQQVFGDDLDEQDEVDYFPEEYAFSATTVELINLFSILDEKPGSKEDKDEMVRNMYKDVLAPAREEAVA